MSEIDLLPRADIPVLFNDFKCKADAVWAVVDTLVVTDVTQKEQMALARKTRLTLREIRIAVEHKRVELGEGHLKEIQKVNGAARAIREFIEPLEARLLHQESFAERVEADRVIELTKSRNDEVRAIWPGCPGDFGKMSQDEYTALITRLRKESAEMAEYKRKQAEAEAKLAEVKAEAIREATAARAEAEIKLAAQRDEQKRLNDEAEQVRFEQEKKHRDELSAALAIRTLEREEAAQRGREAVRIEREKNAKLEAELAAIALDAARVAAVEEKRLRDIEVAPDVEKLRDYHERLRGVKCPVPLATQQARDCFEKVIIRFNEIASIINTFCQE